MIPFRQQRYVERYLQAFSTLGTIPLLQTDKKKKKRAKKHKRR